MTGLQLEKTLNEVLRDYHKENDNYCNLIKNQIVVWYYTTLIQPEKCIALLVEFITCGNLSLRGCF